MKYFLLGLGCGIIALAMYRFLVWLASESMGVGY